MAALAKALVLYLQGVCCGKVINKVADCVLIQPHFLYMIVLGLPM